MAKINYEKAWQTLKEELLTEYPYLVRVWESTNGEGEHAEMCKANEILERMNELDGTHEFSNLLDDMDRSEWLWHMSMREKYWWH